MDIGIDKIGFYTPKQYIDMATLGEARDVDPNKYIKGLGQEEMAVASEVDDAVTMAAQAALSILNDADKEAIDMVLVGSESGVDNSKSIAVWVHELTGINKHARAVELKQACYGTTAAMKMAVGHVMMNPESKVLVIGSDVAKYGLNTGGEPTQGAGAVAMVVAKDPSIATINNDSATYTKSIPDFWRPLYSDYAMVDGHYSNSAYLGFLSKVWEQYKEKTGLSTKDFKTLLFHTPFTKMGKKALNKLAEVEKNSEVERLMSYYEASRYYNKKIGNIYTGSLYLSLISLLEQAEGLEAGDRIGLFSYGSGAVGEFFSIELVPGFRDALLTENHETQLSNRYELNLEDYERAISFSLPKDGSVYETNKNNVQSGDIILEKVDNHIRYYKTIS